MVMESVSRRVHTPYHGVERLVRVHVALFLTALLILSIDLQNGNTSIIASQLIFSHTDQAEPAVDTPRALLSLLKPVHNIRFDDERPRQGDKVNAFIRYDRLNVLQVSDPAHRDDRDIDMMLDMFGHGNIIIVKGRPYLCHEGSHPPEKPFLITRHIAIPRYESKDGLHGRLGHTDSMHEISITAGDFDGIARGGLQYPGDIHRLGFGESPSEFIIAAHLHEDGKTVADFLSCRRENLGHDPQPIFR